ncbi:MAG: hypothetical protein HC915_16145 [Anaerolineae bacterium]|nr:hypothetical protein [Anaerolineae bacterium]
MDAYQPVMKSIRFGPEKTAQLIETLPTISAVDVVRWFALPALRHTIVVHGGGQAVDRLLHTRLKRLLADSLVRFAEDNPALVADGGTDAGVMEMLGDAYALVNATFPLMGITVGNAITYPGGPPPAEGRFPLNPDHTHFVVLEANDFGAESQLLVGMARSSGPSGLAMVINGGQIVRNEVEMHARLGTPIIAIKGSGRYADDLANAAPGDPLRTPFDEGSYLAIFDMDHETPEALYHLIRRTLLR